ncbi:MAG: type I secretion system permease/ATPase [Alphaproteobacteria bacterium]
MAANNDDTSSISADRLARATAKTAPAGEPQGIAQASGRIAVAGRPAPDSAPTVNKAAPNKETGGKVAGGNESGGKPAAAITTDEVLQGQKDWHIAPSTVDFIEPLLASLTTLAALLQRPISAEALRAGLPQGRQSLSPEMAVRAAERAGLDASITRRPKLEQILPVVLPCILLLDGANTCSLLRYLEDGQAEIILPEGGGTKKAIDLSELQTQYTGYAIFARAEYKFDKRISEIRLSQPRAWFWGTLAQFWPIYSHVLLASILINSFALASPLFIMNVYDRVVPNNAIETLWVLALGVTTVFVFEFVMRNIRTYFVDVAGKNADVIIASRLLEQLMSMKLANKGPSTGAMANNLREFESLREFFTSGTVVALVDLPFILLFLAVIWLVAGSVAFIPLAAVPAVILVGALLQIPLRRVIEKTYREATQKHALLVETIDGLETIKATAAEGRVQRAWERFVGLTAESSGKARFLSSLATTFAQVSIQLVTVAVVVYGVHMIGAGEITMGALVAATILTGRALAPLGSIASMLTRLQQSRVALKSLDAIMKAPIERPVGKTFLHRPRLGGQIEMQGVSFCYPGQERPALDGISFKIKPGEKIGILGRIGSGKSTIARLLLGLYDPSEGAVHMDGTDIRQIDPADLRRNIGYVSQDNYLFFGTVRDNIAFGAPHVDDATVSRAAYVAGVSDFLRTHPHGFDLQVGERGMGLSGGQRQAIVIARSLLLDPPIILMDEPTSNMDNSTEALFKRRLQQILPGKTLLLVTHRSSLLSMVDRLIVIDGGKVVADGPKEDVLNALKQGQIRAAKT